MADIGIQEKKGSIWPWVIVALVAALLLWWFLSRGDDVDDTTVVDGGAVTAPMVTDTVGIPGTGGMTAGAGAAVTTFIAHAQRNADGTLGADHVYTAAGLRQLADAIREVNSAGAPAAGGEMSSQLDILRTRADNLERNAQSSEHARMAQEAMVTGAELMQALQQRAPGAADHVTRMRQSAQAIQPGAQMLEQRQHIKDYFDHAAAALRTMTGQAS